jgi:hypothetical protein
VNTSWLSAARPIFLLARAAVREPADRLRLRHGGKPLDIKDVLKIDGAPTINEAVLDIGTKHALGALLGCGVEDLAALPQKIQQDLTNLKAAAIAQDLELSPHHDEFLFEFDRARRSGMIRGPVVALKGAHLRRTVYANAPYRRVMLDLDILLSEEDFPAARELLTRRGLKHGAESAPRFHLAMCHDEAWAKTLPSGRMLKVDLHRALIHRMRAAPPVESLLKAARPLPGTPRVHGLAPVHCAVHLAIHLGNDFYRGTLRSLVDLDLLVLHEGLTPADFSPGDPVLKRGQAALYLAFFLLDRFLGDADPRYRELMDSVRPSAFRRRALESTVSLDTFLGGDKAGSAFLREATLAVALIDSPLHRLLFPAYKALIMGLKLART